MKLIDWDNILIKFINYYRLPIELISPYGFEVMCDEKYLEYDIKRFYIYYKGDINEKIFKDTLLEYLEDTQRDFFRMINVIGSRRYGFDSINCIRPQCNNIFIAFEKIQTDEPLIDNYAKYISCSFVSLAKLTLPEINRIDYNAMARLRIRQLFKIYQSLYYDFFTDEMNIFIDKLSYIPTSINFYNVVQEPLFHEKEDILTIVKYCQYINARINNKYLINFKYNLYGSDKIIINKCNKNIINSAIEKVILSYKDIHQIKIGTT